MNAPASYLVAGSASSSHTQVTINPPQRAHSVFFCQTRQLPHTHTHTLPPHTCLGRQRPSSVSHTGMSSGQQCSLSAQQVALTIGQQPQLKQKPAMSLLEGGNVGGVGEEAK
jgi:hypothetical protein